MTYLSEDALPRGVRPIAFPWRAPSAGTPGEKHSIECGCGATIIMEPMPRAVSGNGQPAAKPLPAGQTAGRLIAPPAQPNAVAGQSRMATVAEPAPAAPVSRSDAPRPVAPAPSQAPRPVVEDNPKPVVAEQPKACEKLQTPAKTAPLRPATPVKSDIVKSVPAVQIESIKPAPLPGSTTLTKPSPAPFPTPKPVARHTEPRLKEIEPPVDPRQTVMVDTASVEAIIPVAEAAPAKPMAPSVAPSVAVRAPTPGAAEIEAPQAVPEGDLVMCGICQSRIAASEQMTTCPECALTFHADCWSENRGCAAYGCSQVGVLEPPEASAVKELNVTELTDPFPWEFLLLGASVIGAVAGAGLRDSFGVSCGGHVRCRCPQGPAALAALGIDRGAVRRRAARGGRILQVLVAGHPPVPVGRPMIDFACPGCGQSFSVPHNAAGRRVRCKKCGRESEVPAARQAAPVPQITPMRLRRLRSDQEQMQRAFASWPHVRIEAARGDPPDLYVIEYVLKGLEKIPRVKDPIPRSATASRFSSSATTRGWAPSAGCSRRSFIPTSTPP